MENNEHGVLKQTYQQNIDENFVCLGWGFLNLNWNNTNLN